MIICHLLAPALLGLFSLELLALFDFPSQPCLLIIFMILFISTALIATTSLSTILLIYLFSSSGHCSSSLYTYLSPPAISLRLALRPRGTALRHLRYSLLQHLILENGLQSRLLLNGYPLLDFISDLR